MPARPSMPMRRRPTASAEFVRACHPPLTRPGASPARRRLVTLRQTEHALGDKVEDHFTRNRRDAGDHGFAEVTLHEILFRVAHAAVCEHRRFACAESRFGAEIL